MYKLGSSVFYNIPKSKVSTTLNVSFYFQSFRFSIISSLESNYPPVDHEGSGNSNFRNNFDRSTQFSSLNDFRYVSRNPNGFHDFYRESYDSSNQFTDCRKNSKKLQHNFSEYPGNNHYNMDSVERSRFGGQFKHVNNFPNLGGNLNGFVKETPDTAYDLRNMRNVMNYPNCSGYKSNNQTTHFGVNGPTIHNPKLGSRIHDKKAIKSPNKDCNDSNKKKHAFYYECLNRLQKSYSQAGDSENKSGNTDFNPFQDDNFDLTNQKGKHSSNLTRNSNGHNSGGYTARFDLPNKFVNGRRNSRNLEQQFNQYHNSKGSIYGSRIGDQFIHFEKSNLYHNSDQSEPDMVNYPNKFQRKNAVNMAKCFSNSGGDANGVYRGSVDFSNVHANSWQNSENMKPNFHGNNHFNMGSAEGSRKFRPSDNFGFDIYPNSNHAGPNMENYSDGFWRKNANNAGDGFVSRGGDANSVYGESVNSWNVCASCRNNYMQPNFDGYHGNDYHNMHNGRGSRINGQLNCFNMSDMYPNSNHIGSVMERYSNGFQRSNKINHVDNFQGWRGNADGVYRDSFGLPHEYVNDWRCENMQPTFDQYHGNYHHNGGSVEGSTIGGQIHGFNNFQYLGGGPNGFEMGPNNNPYVKRNMMNMQNYVNQYQGNNQVPRGPLNVYQNLRSGGNQFYQGRFSPNAEYNGPNWHKSYDSYASNLYNLQQDEYQRYRQASNFSATQNFQGEESRFSCEFNQMNVFQGLSHSQRMAPQYTNANGYYYQDQFGMLSTNLQQNSNGYVQQFNPDEFHGGNSNGHRSILNNAVSGEGNLYAHWNTSQNIKQNSASMHNNVYGYQSNNYGEMQRNVGEFDMYDALNVSNGYPVTSFGQVQHSSSNGFMSKYPDNHSQYNFSVADMLNTNYSPRKKNQYSADIGEFKRYGSGNIDKKSIVDDDYPYDCRSGFFRESGIMFNQQPNEYYNPNFGQAGQDFNNYNLSETKEIVSYDKCVYKLGVFCEEGKVKEAVATLGVLEKLGMDIEVSSYLKLVQICGKAKLLDNAKLVHSHLSWSLEDIQVSVYNEMLEMYSKCSSMCDAYKLFHEMTEKNNATWETMIRGLAYNGLGEEAIDLFDEFKKTGLKPDGSLFNALFYACGVLSAVDQGMLYFKSMRVDYGISPVMENFACIVDMLGRSGHLDEAFEFIESMPINPTVNLWLTLLNFCRINGHIELGNRCAEIVEAYDPSKLTDESKMGLLESKSLELLKDGIISDDDSEYRCHRTYEYVAGRTNDHVMDERLRCLSQQMKEAGHVPDITCTLHDIDPESREEGLMFHSERMAMIHTLMTSPVRREIRIIKNLRVCRDCHNAMKIASKLTGRLIIARDAKRFHHFKDGKCSCNDFW